MKHSENTRFECTECQITFDLCVAPPSECREQFEDMDDVDMSPTCCRLLSLPRCYHNGFGGRQQA
jgi:hypothetical protein